MAIKENDRAGVGAEVLHRAIIRVEQMLERSGAHGAQQYGAVGFSLLEWRDLLWELQAHRVAEAEADAERLRTGLN